MDPTSSRKLALSGRRNFVKALSGLGISAGAIKYLSQDALAEITEDPTDEVPRLSRLEVSNNDKITPEGQTPPDREATYYTIPRDEWAYTEGAHAAAKEVYKKSKEIVGKSPVIVSVKMITEGGHKKKAVEVSRVEIVSHKQIDGESKRTYIKPEYSLDKLAGELPDEASGRVGRGEYTEVVEGYPIVFNDIVLEEEYYSNEYRPLMGGCQMRQDYTAGRGTLATPVYHSSGTYEMVTAAHCVDNNLESGTIYQPGSFGSGFGEVSQFEYYDVNSFTENVDCATIDTSLTNNNPDPYLAEDDGSRGRQLIGTVGYDELKDNLGNTSYVVTKQGVATGRQQGHITRLGDSSLLGYIQLDAESAGGDSGGPYYREFGSNSALMVGMHCWSNSRGHVFPLIEDEFNIEVAY